jgi:hypothetical protein
MLRYMRSRSLAKATPMFRVTTLLLIALAMQTAAIAEEDDKKDTVQVHGKSLALSCAEWKRNQDGSWISTGPLMVGTDTLTNVTLRGAKETQVLETKCGNAPKPSATPSRTDDPTRQKMHGHHQASPADGT